MFSAIQPLQLKQHDQIAYKSIEAVQTMTIYIHEIRLVGRRKKDDGLVLFLCFMYTHIRLINESRTDGNDRRIMSLGEVLNIYEKCASS